MSRPERCPLLRAALHAAAGLVLVVLPACSEPRAGVQAEPSAARPSGDAAPAVQADAHGASPADEAAAREARSELLALAFRAATAMPAHPHIKDRSRAQEEVITAWLLLDEPAAAAAHIDRIDNWRRGACWADLAHWLALRGETADVPRYLGLAADAAQLEQREPDETVSAQAWRLERVHAKIARTWLLLGKPDKAAEFMKTGSPEAGVTPIDEALFAEGVPFEKQLAALDAALTTDDFEHLNQGLLACVRVLHGGDNADDSEDEAARRAQIEQRIAAHWRKLPLKLALEFRFDLTESTREHRGPAAALALINETQLVIDGEAWLPEDRVPVLARQAALRGLAGEAERARAELTSALGLYEASQARIADIDRADVLRPVAEAWQALGDTEAARAIYARAVEAGAQNPNARPRAEDLVATCCSMALAGVQPDAELLARMNRIGDELRSPW